MLLLNRRDIGNQLLAIRKRCGMTQMEVAEAAGLSCRTYADIERGTVNMRVDTILHICQEPSVFSGIMKCPECGGNLTFHFNQNNHDIKFSVATTIIRDFVNVPLHTISGWTSWSWSFCMR